MSRSPDYDTPVEDMSVHDLITMQKAAVFEMRLTELMAENVRLGAATNGDNEPKRWNYLIMTVDSGIPDVIGQWNLHSDALNAWKELIEGNGHGIHECEANKINHVEAFEKGYFCYHKTEYRVHTIAWEGEA